MKLTFLLIVLGALQTFANSFSQTAEITLDLKNAPIAQVFHEIEQQCDVRFLYINEVVRDKTITLSVEKTKLQDVLNRMMNETEMKFTVLENNLIVITPNTISGQGIRISGRVVASVTNEALPGVNVVEKGTTNGTITDTDGNFTITVAGPNSVLVFSFIGYLTKEVEVRNQTSISLALVENIEALQEVVVIGYGTISKQNLTTSIVKVDPEDVPSAANNNISQLLFGRAAGLSVVQESNEPGGRIDLSIRGRSNPLIVIDGIVYPNSGLEPDNGTIELQGVDRGGLADINPNDIESVEVLKDASASIYGVAAADGVILITTKKGRAGKMNVTYNGSHSVVRAMNYIEPLNAADYMTYFNHLYEDKYLYDRRMDPFGATPAMGLTIPYSDSVIAAAGDGTNWLDEVIRNGSIDNHSLSINGGSEKVSYFFSGNYYHQNGILEHSDLTRYNGRLNVSFQLAKFLKLYTSINASRNFYTNSGAGEQAGGSGSQGYGMLQAALAYDPTIPVRNEDGSYSQFAIIANPVSLIDVKDNTVSSGILSTISLDIDIIPNLLKGKLLYGNNFENANRDFYIPSTVYWGQIYQSRGSLFENRRQNQTMEAILSFNKKIGEFLNLDLMGGVGQYQDDYYSYGIEASDMLDAINTSSIEAAPTKTAFSSKSVDKKRSYFARGNFDILDKYLVMLSIRYDGYDKFFSDNKFAAFPSASVGWKISNESFLMNVDMINLLKLRASIGTTGRTWGTVAMGRFESDKNGTRQVQVTFDDGQTIYPAYYQVATDQPDLEWEKTVMTNIGLDFSLFGSRLSGSVDLFQDDNPNLIYSNAPTAPLASIQTYPVNSGHQVRKGYEIAINTINVKSGIVEWRSILNLSHYKHTWVERPPYEGLQSYINETDPVRAIYVYETDGILQIGETASDYQPSNARQPGSPVFVDRDGNDSLNNDDVVMYSMDPKIIIGFGNNFTIKNWDLGIFFYGQFGAWDWNNSYAWADPLAFVNGTQNGSQDIRNVWSTENPDGILPGIAYNESSLGLSAGVDTWLDKKDFVRCRNITLGYTFNNPALKKVIPNLRLYLDAQNPFIITKYKGGDPEISFPKPRVSAAAPYPMTSTFSIGVNANF
ncbi:MAG: SusC/RagA family TonB-linked outer membrane protein [Bacteroidales bacterium]|nr:SusC/RagA family TonB-linked outer membrane protein [Bacteroidales bacterium]MBN2762522.1 SusC/RagA family TonB-linked outer membrane protein [Bacteroidales bacterium]